MFGTNEYAYIRYNNAYIRSPKHFRMDLRCQRPTVKHKHVLVIVWGAFHYEGVVPLVHINAIMDQNIYKNILNHMLFDARKEKEKKNGSWMDVSAG